MMSTPDGKSAGAVELDRLRAALDALDEVEDDRAYLQDLNVSEVVEAFLDVCSEDDVELGEQVQFLDLASDLLRRKAASFVAPDDVDEEELDEEEASERLLEQLREYRRYQEAAQELRRRAEDMDHRFPRLSPEIQEWEEALADIEGADLSDLVFALESLLVEEEPVVHTIERDPVTIEDCIESIQEKLSAAPGPLEFARIFPVGGGRSIVVLTFVALLELIRRRAVRVAQEKGFGTIMVQAVVHRGSDDAS